jgi:hypothetical protein
MADESDPPRKFYQFKPKEFEVVNDRVAPLPAPDSGGPPDAGPTEINAGRIDVRDLFKQANASGPRRPAELRREDGLNDVQLMMRESAAREQKAVPSLLTPQIRRSSKRKRDYWLALFAGYALIALAVVLFGPNVITLGFAAGGVILLTIGLTWIMWFVLDDY